MIFRLLAKSINSAKKDVKEKKNWWNDKGYASINALALKFEKVELTTLACK